MDDQNNQQQDTANQIIEGEYHSNLDLVEIEKERIKSVRLAIETNDAADKRVFDFHMSRLEHNTEIKREQIKIAKTITYGGCIFISIILSILIYMAFLGTDQQVKTAQSIFEAISKGLAGVAGYIITKGIYNKLTNNSQE
jgi:hypothetical protein